LILRGLAALALVGGYFLITDLVQRTVIAARIRWRPTSRERVLSAWVKWVSRTTSAIIERIGGTRMSAPVIPLEPGVLVLMNHQSLLDILVIFKMFGGDYPRIITRRRYRTGIPLVSYMLRLYDHPIVDPGLGRREQFLALRELAVTSTRPIVIFAEGARAKDGAMQSFVTGGLKILLSARAWSVYGVVLDGLWRSGRLGDYVRNAASTKASAESLGPFAFDHERDDADAFITSIHQQMQDKLQAMRDSPSAAKPT